MPNSSVASLSREQVIREVGRTLQNYIRIMERTDTEE
jgi:hypothetical protein